MSESRAMIEAHPHRSGVVHADVLAACIDACFACERVCSSCADACLADEMVADMRRCIRLCLDCADVCGATGRLVSRLTQPDYGLLSAQLRACEVACGVCASECESMDMRHCQLCAEACRRCEAACRELLTALASA